MLANRREALKSTVAAMAGSFAAGLGAYFARPRRVAASTISQPAPAAPPVVGSVSSLFVDVTGHIERSLQCRSDDLGHGRVTPQVIVDAACTDVTLHAARGGQMVIAPDQKTAVLSVEREVSAGIADRIKRVWVATGSKLVRLSYVVIVPDGEKLTYSQDVEMYQRSAAPLSQRHSFVFQGDFVDDPYPLPKSWTA